MASNMNDIQTTPTIELMYHWLLRIVAIGSAIFALGKILFYLSIASTSNTPDDQIVYLCMIYMVAAIIGAGFNISVWWWLRKLLYSASYALFIILGNSFLISVYWIITFQIYETFFTILIIYDQLSKRIISVGHKV